MFIDYATNIIIKKQHICIYMNCRTILCRSNFTLNIFNNGNILSRIH